MSNEFIPNPTGVLFLASPSPTILAPDHVPEPFPMSVLPEPFPMSVPSSPRLPLIHLPPSTLPPTLVASPIDTTHTPPPPASPASPPTNLTHLEKRALRAHRSLTRSGSESSGKVGIGREGEVEGPINMTEPWIEGPKSTKVSGF